MILHNLFSDLFAAITGAYPADDVIAVIEFTVVASAIILAHDEGKRITTNGLANHVGIARSTLRDKLDLWIAKGYIVRDESGNLDIPETLLMTAHVNAAVDRVRDVVIERGEQLKRLREAGEK